MINNLFHSPAPSHDRPAAPRRAGARPSRLRRAKPRDHVADHIGLLARDRAPRFPRGTGVQTRLDRLNAEAPAAGEARLVRVAQRRLGEGEFAHVLASARKPPSPAVPLAIRNGTPPSAQPQGRVGLP